MSPKGKILDVLQMRLSQEFIGRHSFYSRSDLREIYSKDGQLIGYELRPLYQVSHYGTSDIVDIHYWTEDVTVNVSVDIQNFIKKRFRQRNSMY